MPRGKSKRKRVETGKWLPARKSLNTSAAHLENSKGDLNDAAFENLMACAIRRQGSDGPAWIRDRVDTALMLARIPEAGQRWA